MGAGGRRFESFYPDHNIVYMKLIKISNTIIHLHNGPIGISCSGGADSSVLLYILMKYSTDPIHIFTCSSKLKNYSSSIVTARVINQCIKLTDNNNIIHHTHYVNEQSIENLFYKEQFEHIGILYTAITKNPSQAVTDHFKNPITEIERNPGVIKPLYNKDSTVYTPFSNIDKQEIYNLYKELDLLNTLFPLTRSCESLTLIDGHCGECWWCEERQWGFGRL